MALALIQSGLNRFGPSITNVSAGSCAAFDDRSGPPYIGTAAYANNIFRLSGGRLELLGIAMLLGTRCYGRHPIAQKLLLAADVATTVYLLWMGSFATVACFAVGYAFNKAGEEGYLGPLQCIYRGIQENRFYSRYMVSIIATPGYFAKGCVIGIMILEAIPRRRN